MMRKLLVGVLLILGALIPWVASSQTEPTVRIGLDQNATTVTVRSTSAFRIQQQSTRTAKFSTVLAIEPDAVNRTLKRDDLQYRMVVELGGGVLVVFPMSNRVRIDSGATPVEFD